VSELTRDVLAVLTLVAAVCGLVLFALAVAGFVLAAWRVGVQKRPLVLPFGGSEELRTTLMPLFIGRIAEIEDQWVQRANELKAEKAEFEAEYDASPKAVLAKEGEGTPLADGGALPPVRSEPTADRQGRTGLRGIGLAPRSTGDESIPHVLALGDNSLANVDLGAISVAGVSFSPEMILALLRRVPTVFARRRITGTVAELGQTAVLGAIYEERRLWRSPRTVRRRVRFDNGDWLSAIDLLSFQLAKGRVEVIRDRRREAKKRTRRGSETAERAFIEAESWEACEAFLLGYIHQFRHYLSGTASERERALELYTAALGFQPDYTHAHYNRATLLYNRYLAGDNHRAIEGFLAATASRFERVQALAFAGLAMAYGQEVHRFGATKDDVAADALDASERALALEPTLEEAHFAAAWALQIDEQWEKSVAGYRKVYELQSDKDIPPAARIKSFAYNNGAWVTMNKLRDARADPDREAEELLWQAVRLYPNKIAYGNLAEIARRHQRYEDAKQLFEYALQLDRSYVNGWHEFALLELERAGHAATQGDAQSARAHYDKAKRNQKLAESAGDEETAADVRAKFETALDSYRDKLRGLGPGSPEVEGPRASAPNEKP
jgi:tetratricopeptide (TPR) repeat protein